MSLLWWLLGGFANKSALRDLAEMFLIRGLVLDMRRLRDWEANLPTAWLKDTCGGRRSRGKVGQAAGYVAETYISGAWSLPYRLRADRFAMGVGRRVMLSARTRPCDAKAFFRAAKGLGDRFVNPGLGHHGPATCLSQGNPDRARPPCAESYKSLFYNPNLSRINRRHQGPMSTDAWIESARSAKAILPRPR